MKNTLSDLNNYLFEQLERLNDDSLNEDQLAREIKKSDAIVKVSEKIIDNGELAFKAMQHRDRYYTSSDKKLPTMLETNNGDW